MCVCVIYLLVKLIQYDFCPSDLLLRRFSEEEFDLTVDYNLHCYT